MGTSELNQLPAGTRIGGRYEILEVIGQGGFGITYRGYDLTLDVPVAIKEYYPSGIASRYSTRSLEVQVGGVDNQKQFAKGKEKFLEEARALAKFSEDPNVVAVRDFFEDNSTVYIVMQFLQGESLKEYTEKNGLLTFDDAYEMLRPIMQSLDRMHKSGLIHRDISPSNLIRMRSGKIKLIDFGTVREISAEGEKSLSVMLKPGYAPAEQYRTHGSQGPWTDVYALCASIYKLITGEVPENSLNRLLEDELIPPSACGAQISPAQEEALLRGMAVREKDRIQNMRELEETFEQASRAIEENAGVPAYDDDDERTVMGPQAGVVRQADNAAAGLRQASQAGAVRQADNAAAGLRRATQAGAVPQPDNAIADLRQAPQEKKAGRQTRPDRSKQKRRDLSEEKRNKSVRKKNKEEKAERKDRPRRKIWPVIVVILAVAAAAAVFLLRSNGDGGGTIKDWTDGKKQVLIGYGSTGTTVTNSMLDEIDRNKDIVRISFMSCTLSDEVIERLADMKRIQSLNFDGSSGFTTLNPLADLKTLEDLDLSPFLADEKAIDTETMFGADIPQLKKFSFSRYRLKGGLAFLRHFTGLEELFLSNLELADEDTAGMPEMPALRYAGIYHTDLSHVDLTGLGKSAQLKDLTLEDTGIAEVTFLEPLSELTSFSAADNLLTSLDGLQNKENLTRLSLERNQIRDISALAGAPALTNVSLDDNLIDDISAFEQCPELDNLSLNRNAAADLSPLAACSGLVILKAADNQIEDVSVLAGFKDLHWVDLSGNRISDLSALKDSVKMSTLIISRNSVSDLAFCESMLELEKLQASENQISSLEGLQNVTQLEEIRIDKNQIADLSVLAKNAEHLERAVLDENRITDLSPLGACTKLKAVSANGNQLTSLNGLEHCQELNFLSASGNQLTDITALGSCPALYMADLGENEISDISALGASQAEKMAVLLQNNQIQDMSPLYGMKDYVYLSLYNNEITDISGISAMKNIGSNSIIYLDWWEGLQAEDLSETSYRDPRLVDTPPDRQVNLQNAFQDARREAGAYGKITYLTKDEADQNIQEIRTDARVNAGIEVRAQTEEEENETDA